jgi:hypothetical protein
MLCGVSRRHQLLVMALELFPGEVPLSLPMPSSDHPVFVEMIDFLAKGAQIVGLTSVGRATATLLQFNEPRRLIQRRALIAAGRYPHHA